MTYLVAVLKDRIQAEAAYTALEKAGLPMQAVKILGRGYLSADDYGLIDPAEPAERQINLLSFWLLPFGFGAGVAFSILSGLQTFAWAGEIGNHLLGGVLGAVAGAMGSFFVGGGVGAALGGGDALTYRNRLEAGRYLIILQGSDSLIQEATPILRSFQPERLQGYLSSLSADS